MSVLDPVILLSPSKILVEAQSQNGSKYSHCVLHPVQILRPKCDITWILPLAHGHDVNQRSRSIYIGHAMHGYTAPCTVDIYGIIRSYVSPNCASGFANFTLKFPQNSVLYNGHSRLLVKNVDRQWRNEWYSTRRYTVSVVSDVHFSVSSIDVNLGSEI